MITMARIQGSSMGFHNFQKPILQTPRLGGIFDFDLPQIPQFPPFDLPLAPGSDGGADGGDAPAPAPPAGEAPPAAPPSFEPLPPGFYPPQPRYLYAVQDQTTPTPTPTPTATQSIPTWAIVGGSVIAGIAVAALLLK